MQKPEVPVLHDDNAGAWCMRAIALHCPNTNRLTFTWQPVNGCRTVYPAQPCKTFAEWYDYIIKERNKTTDAKCG